jgi:hypothetical protein
LENGFGLTAKTVNEPLTKRPDGRPGLSAAGRSMAIPQNDAEPATFVGLRPSDPSSIPLKRDKNRLECGMIHPTSGKKQQ